MDGGQPNNTDDAHEEVSIKTKLDMIKKQMSNNNLNDKTALQDHSNIENVNDKTRNTNEL